MVLGDVVWLKYDFWQPPSSAATVDTKCRDGEALNTNLLQNFAHSEGACPPSERKRKVTCVQHETISAICVYSGSRMSTASCHSTSLCDNTVCAVSSSTELLVSPSKLKEKKLCSKRCFRQFPVEKALTKTHQKIKI